MLEAAILFAAYFAWKYQRERRRRTALLRDLCATFPGQQPPGPQKVTETQAGIPPAPLPRPPRLFSQKQNERWVN